MKRGTRDSAFEQALTTSVSPLKKKKLGDDDDSSDDVVFAVSSPLTGDSALGGEEDEQSSSISSGCFSSESNEIARKIPTFGLDLEAHEISETETSTFINRNFRKERNPLSEVLGETTEVESSSATEIDDRRKPHKVSKTPTPVEIEEFFSELENDEKQKQFIEKYNFDIVNDEPLPGRYKWDLLKPINGKSKIEDEEEKQRIGFVYATCTSLLINRYILLTFVSSHCTNPTLKVASCLDSKHWMLKLNYNYLAPLHFFFSCLLSFFFLPTQISLIKMFCSLRY